VKGFQWPKTDFVGRAGSFKPYCLIAKKTREELAAENIPEGWVRIKDDAVYPQLLLGMKYWFDGKFVDVLPEEAQYYNVKDLCFVIRKVGDVSKHFAERHLPEGYQKATEGCVVSGDLIWSPKYACFKAAVGQRGSNVKAYHCVDRPIPQKETKKTDEVNLVVRLSYETTILGVDRDVLAQRIRAADIKPSCDVECVDGNYVDVDICTRVGSLAFVAASNIIADIIEKMRAEKKDLCMIRSTSCYAGGAGNDIGSEAEAVKIARDLTAKTGVSHTVWKQTL